MHIDLALALAHAPAHAQLSELSLHALRCIEWAAGVLEGKTYKKIYDAAR